MALFDTHEYASYFTIRRPLISIGELDRLLEQHRCFEKKDAAGVIQQLLADETITAAIQLSSPGFLNRVRTAATSTDLETTTSALTALMKFVVRMATRSTPFASFASVCLGHYADQPQMVIEPAIECRLEIDCGLLLECDRRIRRQLKVEGSLRLRRAPIVHQGLATYRYVERADGRELYRFDLSRLDRTLYIDRVLDFLASPATVADLASDLRAFDSEISFQDATDFIASLYQSGLCEFDIGLQLIGGNVLDNYLERLAGAAPDSATFPEVVALRHVAGLLNGLSPCSPAQASVGIAEIEHYLAGEGLPAVPGKTVHTDAFAKQTNLAISPAQLDALGETISCLHRLVGRPASAALGKFSESFEERFGEQFVPLMVALDPETGLEFGRSSPRVPWIAGLGLAPARGAREAPDQMLCAWLCNELQFGNYQIDLTAIGQLQPGPPVPLPNDFSALISLYTATEEAPARIALHHITAPGATSLNARFSARHAGLAEALIESVAREDGRHIDAVVAEIVHLPAPRTGNILGRAGLGRYEIVLSGIPSVPQQYQLSVDDLLLGVVHGKVVLWSQRLRCRVIPRLSSAHHFSSQGNLGLYQFLCTLAQQDVAVVNFQWPRSFHDADFLPRVVHKDVIIAPARWQIRKGQVKQFLELVNEARWAELQAWFSVRRIPRWFALRNGDNLLETDRTSQLSLAMLADELGRLREATFVESFARLGVPGFHTGTEQWHSELVIPIHRPHGVTVPGLDRSRPIETCAPATSVHGQRWSYLKVYGGEEYLDTLLIEECQPVLQQAVDAGWISSWFYVRYHDPRCHLRLRWLGSPDGATRTAGMLAVLLQAKLDNHEIASIVSDSYLPEFRRYGGREHMSAAEQIFFADSDYSVTIRRLAAQQDNDELVWQGALCGALDYMTQFGLFGEARIAFLQRQRDAFGGELAISDAQKRQLSNLYRRHRVYVEEVVGDELGIAIPIQAALRQRSFAAAQAIVTLIEGLPQARLVDILSSIIHMQCNRVFIGNSRPQEFVMWDFLVRAQRSVLARKQPVLPSTECA